jgi:hypothetical protein
MQVNIAAPTGPGDESCELKNALAIAQVDIYRLIDRKPGNKPVDREIGTRIGFQCSQEIAGNVRSVLAGSMSSGDRSFAPWPRFIRSRD